MSWSVRSEVGQLRVVLVHRPGLELQRLTPANKDALLFDELLWVEHAQVEHDAFVSLLESEGVEVLRLADLLADVLADRDLAHDVIAAHADDRACGPAAGPTVRAHLATLTPHDLVDHLVGGVAIEEVAGVPGLVAASAGPGEMLLDPLPNAVFMRDSSAWIGPGVVLSPMHRLIRRRETALVHLLVRQHPRFAGSRIWFGEDAVHSHPATFEGGDVLVLGDRAVAIGLSERTTASGAETLALRLFAEDVVDRVLAVELPKQRSAMHLDTVVTQVDVDQFITYPSMTRDVRCHAVTRGRGGMAVREVDNLAAGLAWASGLDAVRTIEPALSAVRAEREQWNDANNTLAIRPGEVVAYERNVATNEILDAAGITVHTIPSFELPRGRGGPRCMTCPVLRDPVGSGEG